MTQIINDISTFFADIAGNLSNFLEMFLIFLAMLIVLRGTIVLVFKLGCVFFKKGEEFRGVQEVLFRHILITMFLYILIKLTNIIKGNFDWQNILTITILAVTAYLLVYARAKFDADQKS